MSCSAGQLTLGHIGYLNCVPFFGALQEQGFAGNLVIGVPSQLNRMLQEGSIDASPSSSFEYARNWRDYLLLPDQSIASIGRISSVLLFSPVSPERLSGRTIVITGESATSINLLEVLLRDQYQVADFTAEVRGASIEDLAAQQHPALLIGDRALKLAAAAPAGMQIYDLGELWYEHTGLPFVFALWMIRREALQCHRPALEALGEQLLASRRAVLGRPQAYAESAARTIGLTPAQIVAYWNTIDYRLDPLHLQGLQLFFERCHAHGLLADVPPINFLSA